MYQDPQRSTQQVRVPARSSGQTPTANQNTTQAPAITLPTGGGAIRGIDEKFQVNPATGSGAMTVPIATSPARQGFGPQLSLSYDSGSGSGPFGLGWSLSFPRVTRKTDKGLPTYRDAGESDIFILSGAEDLVPMLVENGGQLTRHAGDAPTSSRSNSLVGTPGPPCRTSISSTRSCLRRSPRRVAPHDKPPRAPRNCAPSPNIVIRRRMPSSPPRCIPGTCRFRVPPRKLGLT